MYIRKYGNIGAEICKSGGSHMEMEQVLNGSQNHHRNNMEMECKMDIPWKQLGDNVEILQKLETLLWKSCGKELNAMEIVWNGMEITRTGHRKEDITQPLAIHFI